MFYSHEPHHNMKLEDNLCCEDIEFLSQIKLRANYIIARIEIGDINNDIISRKMISDIKWIKHESKLKNYRLDIYLEYYCNLLRGKDVIYKK